MKRSFIALALASAALAISASGPAYAADAVDTAPAPVVKTEVVLVANALTVNRTAAPAPRLTYAVLYATASPSAMMSGLGTFGSPLSIA